MSAPPITSHTCARVDDHAYVVTFWDDRAREISRRIGLLDFRVVWVAGHALTDVARRALEDRGFSAEPPYWRAP